MTAGSVPAGAARPAANWRGLAHSVRGASHVRSGAPNQDAGGVRALPGGDVVLAVADGHGDRTHARSDRGSRFAVAVALELVGEWIAATRGQAPGALARACTELEAQLVERWRAAVDEDLAAQPPEPGEGAGRAASPRVLYGTTLIVAGLTATFAIYLQIGDGDLLAVGHDGSVRLLLPGRAGQPLNRTESLCQDDALDRLRTKIEGFSDVPPPALVLLSSDGYANSFSTQEAFLQVGSDLHGYLQDRGFAWVGERLEGWLDQASVEGSGDDITLAFGWNDAGPAPVPAEPPADPTRTAANAERSTGVATIRTPSQPAATTVRAASSSPPPPSPPLADGATGSSRLAESAAATPQPIADTTWAPRPGAGRAQPRAQAYARGTARRRGWSRVRGWMWNVLAIIVAAAALAAVLLSAPGGSILGGQSSNSAEERATAATRTAIAVQAAADEEDADDAAAASGGTSAEAGR